MNKTYQKEQKTPQWQKMEAEGVKLSKTELNRWAQMVYGEDSVNAYIPKVKLVQHCVKCKQPSHNMVEHQKYCKFRDKDYE